MVWNTSVYPSTIWHHQTVYLEHMVQAFKQSLKKTAKDVAFLQHWLANFLLVYRATPQATTTVAPCELQMDSALWTCFYMLQPAQRKEFVIFKWNKSNNMPFPQGLIIDLYHVGKQSYTLYYHSRNPFSTSTKISSPYSLTRNRSAIFTMFIMWTTSRTEWNSN